MIYHLVQTAALHPDLLRGIPPAGLLNAAEQRTFYSLRTPKRQHDWLLGRWTAKRLLQAFVDQTRGEYRALDSFTIINAPNGAPRVTGAYLSCVALSISHRDDYAFCALSESCAEDEPWARVIGADVERVEPRSETFVEDYFTETEIARVRRAPAGERDLLTTVLWSAKEAALKALHLGLTVDTRTVTCGIEPFTVVPQIWTSFDVCYDALPLNYRTLALKGWWRALGDYVLTLVAEKAVCDSADQVMQVTCESPLRLRYSPHVTPEVIR